MRQAVISGQQLHEHRQATEAGVGREGQHQGHRQIDDVERPSGSERSRRQLRQQGDIAARHHPVKPDQEGQTEQHGPQQDSQRDLTTLGTLHRRRSECGYRIGDRLHSGQRGAASRKRLEDNDDSHRLGCVNGPEVIADHGHRVRLEEAEADDGENPDDEEQCRAHQHLRRLRDADQIDHIEHDEPCQCEREQVMRQRWEHARQARGSGRQAHRHCQHVVDQQAGGSQQGRPPAQVLLRHRVRAATVRVHGNHLPVGHHQHHQQPGDRHRDRHGPGHGGGACGDQTKHDRFRPVRDAGQRVQRHGGDTAECGQPVRVALVMPAQATINDSVMYDGRDLSIDHGLI